MWFGEFDLNNLNLQGVANFSEYPAPYHSNSAYDEDLAEILEAPGCAWHWHCVNLCQFADVEDPRKAFSSLVILANKGSN
jgi:hypothetical protein